MNTPSSETIPGRWLRLLPLLAASYGLCIGGFVLRGSLFRSSHLDGALDGLFFSVFLGTLPWLVVLAPLTCVLYGIPRDDRRWFRPLVALAPSIFVFLLIPSSLLIVPPTAANRFQSLTGHILPASAQEVRMYDIGGGFDGVETTFLFRCAAKDTEELIRVLGLQPSGDKGLSAYDDRPDATWPNPRRWEGPAVYSKERLFVESGPRPADLNYTLCTDAARTWVYLNVSP